MTNTFNGFTYSGDEVLINCQGKIITNTNYEVGFNPTFILPNYRLLVIGGGGCGGVGVHEIAPYNVYFGGGGGGAGQYIYLSGSSITLNSIIDVVIGSGGTWSSSDDTIINGKPTIFGIISACGGGAGGASGNGLSENAWDGGSGGGAEGFYDATLSGATGGLAICGIGGNDGGTTINRQVNGAGGGGAGAVGASNLTGGAGISNSISGSSKVYSRGGNGATPSTDPANGNANTGMGGYASGSITPHDLPGGTGGSGVVIIRYTSPIQLAIGGTVTTSGGDYIHTFTTHGVFKQISTC